MGTNTVNTVRHSAEFEVDYLRNLTVDVIGLGVTGLRVATELAGLGVEKLRLWDHDVIEAHNISNQTPAYGVGDIGRPKVEVLAELLKARTGLEAVANQVEVDGTQRLGQVVFLLTDTTQSRRGIAQKAIRRKIQTKLMIETRLGVHEHRVYTINPMNSTEYAGWEQSLPKGDRVVQPSGCGAKTTLGANASALAGDAVGQFIRWLAIQTDRGQLPNGNMDVIEHELLVHKRPHMLMTRMFEASDVLAA